MPASGGVIGVTVVQGLQSYPVIKGKEYMYGILSYAGDASLISYTTHKIDNIDFVASDIRLVKFDGTIDYYGRVELRQRGLWKSLCSIGTDEDFGKKICLDMGYKYGKMASCDGFKGEDYCGSSSQEQAMYGISCT